MYKVVHPARCLKMSFPDQTSLAPWVQGQYILICFEQTVYLHDNVFKFYYVYYIY